MSETSHERGDKRPSKAERDQIRREQIVAAARHCVVRRGFHAAPMAEIAATARMSVGQIYRYFPNKEAIVHAIVERIVELRLQEMIKPPPQGDFPSALAHMMLEACDASEREDQILMLEITAEATRNPAVAEIVKRADSRIKERAISATLKREPHLTAEEARGRVEILASLIEGTSYRRLAGVLGSSAAFQLYRHTVEQVLAAPNSQRRA